MNRATTVLAQHSGTTTIAALHDQVEVLRDQWGIPHIYAKNTADLFFAQGYVVAQDRMWQLEMWRRNGEGLLSEVLGSSYLDRDKFARTLAFRGDWDIELRKYHPEGPVIFASFAEGINAAIRQAIDSHKIPVEFDLMGFQPQPVWTYKTVLTRMPGWTLSRNAATEIARALSIKEFGIAKTEELLPTEPYKKLVVPEGLDLSDIEPAILSITLGANDVRSSYKSDLGSNNWVIGGSKSATGMPLLANDPHREIVNPALRYMVHLIAPGWNVIGATEPGLPGITIGHNERVAWGFTILGMDQQDVYVEETDSSGRYLYKNEWLPMEVHREMIPVKGRSEPEAFDVKITRHGPLLYENTEKHRAFALRWVGADPGGAGYLGSLHVMQAQNWPDFYQRLDRSWYLPSHSLVYADVDGTCGYIGIARTPVRANWDGLLPVPGKDGKYEWNGYVPIDEMPRSLNGPQGYYASANNDVVPKIVPDYTIPFGYEYTPPFRFERIDEVLRENRKFTLADMQNLQEDTMSLPARRLVPLLHRVKSDNAEVQTAVDRLLNWDFVLDKDSVEPTLYEYWVLKLGALAYAPRIPAEDRNTARVYDIRRVIEWMNAPDSAYGPDPIAERDRILGIALEQAIAELGGRMGGDMTKWLWGDIHTADFRHPLLNENTRDLFEIQPQRRGGDGYTVMAASSPTEKDAKQEAGASFKFVMDVQDWDRSTALSTPGNSGQPGSAHYADLAPLWGEGKYFPLAFSRAKVESVVQDRLTLTPAKE